MQTTLFLNLTLHNDRLHATMAVVHWLFRDTSQAQIGHEIDGCVQSKTDYSDLPTNRQDATREYQILVREAGIIGPPEKQFWVSSTECCRAAAVMKINSFKMRFNSA